MAWAKTDFQDHGTNQVGYIIAVIDPCDVLVDDGTFVKISRSKCAVAPMSLFPHGAQ